MAPHPATVLSVNVGGVREVAVPYGKGGTVTTGIYKSPVDGPVQASGVNLAGDDQADRTVHGGPDKAVYAFPSEHFPSWKTAFPGADWSFGAFGENLTTAGLLESDVAVGDRFRCGTAELVVTQPRLPCGKFAIRVGDTAAVRHMLDTRQTGFYLTIASPGALNTGDALEFVDGPSGRRGSGGGGDSQRLTIDRFVALYLDAKDDAEAMAAAAEVPGMPRSWVDWFRERARS